MWHTNMNQCAIFSTNEVICEKGLWLPFRDTTRERLAVAQPQPRCFRSVRCTGLRSLM